MGWSPNGEPRFTRPSARGKNRSMSSRAGSGEAGDWAWIGAMLDERRRPEALRHALRELGFSRKALLEGLASQLGLTATQLREPDRAAVKVCRRDRLGSLIPELVSHPDAAPGRGGARVGERPPACSTSSTRKSSNAGCAKTRHSPRVLEPRLQREGLALVGVDALRRLARTAPSSTRRVAADWIARPAKVR